MKGLPYISPNAVNRLPKYLHYIQEQLEQGADRTTSAKIADTIGATSSQVRQDLGHFGNFGSQGYGYNLKELDQTVQRIIGIHVPHNIAIIGVGSIGRALAEHMDFPKYNFNLCAAFDISPKLDGTKIGGITIRHLSELPEYLENHSIDICILTVSRESAKEVAQLLYEQGIPAIWNFTNTPLDLDDKKITVQNVDFIDSLLALTYYLESSND